MFWNVQLHIKAVSSLIIKLRILLKKLNKVNPFGHGDRPTEVLVARLSDPPSLMELARLVGINDCKLKAGFRQVFGTTVFGYLHNCRMERSRQLLEAGEMSVAQAAQTVGFVNRSHFAIAFRKKFGVNPSTYRRTRSQ